MVYRGCPGGGASCHIGTSRSFDYSNGNFGNVGGNINNCIADITFNDLHGSNYI